MRDTLITRTNVLLVEGRDHKPLEGSLSFAACDPVVITLSVHDPKPRGWDLARTSVSAGLMGEVFGSIPMVVSWGSGTVDVHVSRTQIVRLSAALMAEFLDETYCVVEECPFPASCEGCPECHFCALVIESELRLMGVGDGI